MKQVYASVNIFTIQSHLKGLAIRPQCSDDNPREFRFPHSHDITVAYVWVSDIPITIFEWRFVFPFANVVAVSIADSVTPQAGEDVVEIVPMRLLLDGHNRETIKAPDRTVHERTDVPFLLKIPVAMVLAFHSDVLPMTGKETGKSKALDNMQKHHYKEKG
eukprot:6214699-Pleurochrysis_carterae.AAC.1